MSQQLGLNYQMSPEVMYITPNIWRLGIIFISVTHKRQIAGTNPASVCNFYFTFNVQPKIKRPENMFYRVYKPILLNIIYVKLNFGA